MAMERSNAPSKKVPAERPQPTTQTDMDAVLELVCRELPHGGRHEERKYIAERLIKCAGSGRTTLGDLQIVARRALLDLPHKKSA